MEQKSWVRCGVPRITWTLPGVVISPDMTPDDVIKDLRPTTGGILFGQHWRRDQPPLHSIKLVVICSPSKYNLQVGSLNNLTVTMPPWPDGRIEIRQIKGAKLISAVHTLPSELWAETTEYLFHFETEQQNIVHENSYVECETQNAEQNAAPTSDNQTEEQSI